LSIHNNKTENEGKKQRHRVLTRYRNLPALFGTALIQKKSEIKQTEHSRE
jgi:hypothetical protein